MTTGQSGDVYDFMRFKQATRTERGASLLLTFVQSFLMVLRRRKACQVCDDGFQVLRGFSHGFNASFVSTSAFIYCLFDPPQPFLYFCGRTKNKVQRQKAISIRLSQSQQLKALQAPADIVVIDPSQQLNHLRSRPIVGGVIKKSGLFHVLYWSAHQGSAQRGKPMPA